MTLKIKKSTINNILIFLIFFIFNFIGIIIAFNSRNLANRLNVKIFPIFILSFFLWIMRPVINKNIKNDFILIIRVFCALLFMSSLIRGDIASTISSILTIVIVDILIRLSLGLNIKSLYKIIGISLIVASIIAIYLYSIESYNSQGIVYAFTGIMALNIYLLQEDRSYIKYFILVFLTFLTLIFTKSRTSIMSYLVVAFMTLRFLNKEKNILKSISILIILLIVFFITFDKIAGYFNSIFFNKWRNNDLTSNRIAIWKFIWDNKNLFGHKTLNVDAHNTFFQVLWSDGLIVFALFLILIFYILRLVLIYDEHIIFKNFFIGWFLISLFENLYFINSRMLPVTLLFLLHICLLINIKSKNLIKLDNNNLKNNRRIK